MQQLRLDRFLSDASGISRSEAKKAIAAGRVTVDGSSSSDPGRQVNENSSVMLDGLAFSWNQYRYFLLNKPAGVVCATEGGKVPLVTGFLPGGLRKSDYFPVGRLDKDTRGVLLLTNDGAYCHNVISPAKNVSKCYYARVDGTLRQEHCDRFQAGIRLSDEFVCLPAQLRILSSGAESECLVTVREGKFHQVKRMLAACGCNVTYLCRLSVGNILISRVPKTGDIVELTREEAQEAFRSAEVTDEKLRDLKNFNID